MKSLVKNAVLVSIVTLSGCTTFTDFTETGDLLADPRLKDCDFKIYTTSPKKEFYELGVIDLKPVFCVVNCPDKASNVKKIVQEEVCAAGGNAILLWEANGMGSYTKTTVIKVKE
ncbi:MAG: hypothetical protein ACI910_000608 [Oleispira sp.]|jgi:hypothetical protein